MSEDTQRAVADIGFDETTEIQAKSIPLILSGEDVIGHSQTGTGKTAAFGIPIIELINNDLKEQTQALILCPTRELALQACDEMRKFKKYKEGIKIVPIFGGQPINRQIMSLKRGAQIVIGTPGRIMDHLRRRTLKLQHLSMVVLDEADEMLNMGFREDIETILEYIPKERQTILFSATMSPEIMNITKHYQKNPKVVKVVGKEMTVSNIEQYYYEIQNSKKVDALINLLNYHKPKRSIVFCNTKRMVDKLVKNLQENGFSVDGLHGDMRQSLRTNVMNSFKRGRINILVATDVAARGIDVDDIDSVFNFDIPQDSEYYVHRIGRTGRAGKSGNSHTFVSDKKQLYALKSIEKYAKTKIEFKFLPSSNDMKEIRNQKIIKQINKILKTNSYLENESIVNELLENGNSIENIACASIQLLFENSSNLEDSKSKITKTNLTSSENRTNSSKIKKTTKNKFKQSDIPMTSLIISVGKKDKIAANHIIAAVAGESGIPGNTIGKIDVHDNYTFVEVPKDSTDLVLNAMKGCVINKKVSSTEIVKNKKRRKQKNI